MRKIFIEVDSRGDGRGVARLRALARGGSGSAPHPEAGGALKPLAATLALLALGAALSFLPARRAGIAARSGSPAARGRMRVGLVFDVGGRGDKSFNDAAYAGLVRAEEELGVEGAYLEPAGSEDREAAMRLFAARGFDLVIGVGFIFSSDVDRVARDYPAVRFACVDYAPPRRRCAAERRRARLSRGGGVVPRRRRRRLRLEDPPGRLRRRDERSAHPEVRGRIRRPG